MSKKIAILTHTLSTSLFDTQTLACTATHCAIRCSDTKKNSLNSEQSTAPYTPSNTLQHTLQHTAKYTATHVNTLQNTLQHTSTHYKTLCNTRQHTTKHHTASHCNTLQHTACDTRSTDALRTSINATPCNTLQHTTTHCNTLQRTTTHCNTLHHTATHYTTLQHTSTHYSYSLSSSCTSTGCVIATEHGAGSSFPKFRSEQLILTRLCNGSSSRAASPADLSCASFAAAFAASLCSADSGPPLYTYIHIYIYICYIYISISI